MTVGSVIVSMLTGATIFGIGTYLGIGIGLMMSDNKNTKENK